MKSQAILQAFARSRPAHEALVCGEQRITYAAFERRTNTLAAVLHERGVRTGDRVALLLTNGIAWPELAIAVMKLGALVVPISTRLADREVAFVLGDALPHTLVYSDAVRELALRGAAGGTCAIVADTELYDLAEGVPDAVIPSVDVALDDCLIGYTSGTSGTPKGAITTHANMILVALMNNQQYGLRESDRILVTTAFAHRTAYARMWNALTMGATLVIMPHFDAHETLEQIVRERITVTGVVPTVARMLLDAFAGGPEPYRSLRAMIAVGETFPVELKQRLFTALPGIELYSALAMTETFGAAVLVSADQVEHSGAAGRPVPGVEVRLLDDAGREVATGDVGEIVVRCGVPGQWFMMRGYWNRPSETADVLRDGWLYTGDMGRFDDDGFLFVVDRKKDMILSGGLNIYSKEVERAIFAHPAVADVGVVGTTDVQYGEAVAAFVELRAGAIATGEEIVEHCRAQIAGYKKPKYVVFGVLPRNSQGKVLKTELRERAARLPDSGLASRTR